MPAKIPPGRRQAISNAAETFLAQLEVPQRSEIALLRKNPARESRPKGIVAQLPITSFADWDKVWQVKQVLRGFEGGSDFQQPAMFADAMMRDDRVFGVMATRIGALVGSDVEFKPANKKPKAKDAALALGGNDEIEGKWEAMATPWAVGQLVFWGLMLGIGVAEIVWRTTNPDGTAADEWTPSLRVWHPQFLSWDQQAGVYRLRTAEGMVTLPSPEQNPRLDGQWVIYTPFGYRDGWRGALLRPLAMLYLCRQWAHRDWASHNEVHGQPTTLAKLPEVAPPEEKQAFADLLASRGSNAAILLPQGEGPGTSYGIELLEAQGMSFQTFKEQINKLETDIAVAVLGQNLSTEVRSGSLAAAQVHEGVRLDKRREDARIGQHLRAQLVTHWAEFNLGDPELAPRVCYVVEDPEDELKEVQTLEGVGSAILSLRAAGLQVDAEAIADRYGVPLIPEEDRGDTTATEGSDALVLTPTAVSAIVKVNEARKKLGLEELTGDGGNPDPDGHLTIAEFQAKNADTLAAAVNAEAGGGGGAPGGNGEGGGGGVGGPGGGGGQPSGTELPGPGATEGDLPSPDFEQPRQGRGAPLPGGGTAPRGLDSKTRGAALAGRRTVAGGKRMAVYTQVLEQRAKLRARDALREDVAGIQQEIERATDFDDLKRRVTARYKRKMNSQALARIVEKARLMALLAGRLGAVEDL